MSNGYRIQEYSLAGLDKSHLKLAFSVAMAGLLCKCLYYVFFFLLNKVFLAATKPRP